MAFIMSARACQLCGKPLSRIRVGTDGDFCSREHRNQYRLRQGMDRLMEANKVANLMRRRELPKPIIPQPTDSGASLERRVISQGPPMPVRSAIVTKDVAIAAGSGKRPRLGQSRRAQVALVRFHVLGTGEARRAATLLLQRSLSLFLSPRYRRGGMRSSERPAAPWRRMGLSPRRGELLRVSGSAGFRLRPVEVRHVKPRLPSVQIRPGIRQFGGETVDRPVEVRAACEQWSAIRTRLYVAQPEFSFCQPWSGVRSELREVPGSNPAAGTVPAGPDAARVAQVRIELQESMHYAISSEEDRA